MKYKMQNMKRKVLNSNMKDQIQIQRLVATSGLVKTVAQEMF